MDIAPSALVAISAAVQEGFAAPSFSYQAIASSSAEADTISISPSPSISATTTDLAPSALVAISAAVQEGFAAPLFSYQAIASSIPDADTISISPSLSISAIKTPEAPSVDVETVLATNDDVASPEVSFVKTITSSSFNAVAIISLSPSLSISPAYTERVPETPVPITNAVKVWLPLFSYNVIS